MANIKHITIVDLFSVEEKADLIMEMIEKEIDFNNLPYEEQEKIVLEFKDRMKKLKEMT